MALEYSCDGRPVWSRTSDCQSGNPGSNPGRRTPYFQIIILMSVFVFLEDQSSHKVIIYQHIDLTTCQTSDNIVLILIKLCGLERVCNNRKTVIYRNFRRARSEIYVNYRILSCIINTLTIRKRL
jgi:hypothetical protein